VVGLYIIKIGIGKPAGKSSPIPKVGGDHHFLPFAVPVGIYGKPKVARIPSCGKRKGWMAKSPIRKGRSAKGRILRCKKGTAGNAGRPKAGCPFRKVNRNPAFFQEAEEAYWMWSLCKCEMTAPSIAGEIRSGLFDRNAWRKTGIDKEVV